MHRSWSEIRERFTETSIDAPWVRGLVSLVDHISTSPLSGTLYPWTSMFDLCISQTPPSPAMQSPHLRVSPLQSGKLEFRYIDTMVSTEQWSREVQPQDAIGRFESFVAQLHWLAQAPDAQPCAAADGSAAR